MNNRQKELGRAVDVSVAPNSASEPQSKTENEYRIVDAPEGDLPQEDTRIDVSSADDVNVDEDNAIESPKKSLTAVEPESSGSD